LRHRLLGRSSRPQSASAHRPAGRHLWFGNGRRVRASNVQVNAEGTIFDVAAEGKRLGTLKMQVPGRHNILNALAATVAGLELGISFAQIAEGLAAFEGVGRRLELKGEKEGVRVIDDYGHHPTEIRATLSALRERYPDNRLVVLFQPHRFTRTQSLWNEFSLCFDQADCVFILDIYPAGKPPSPASPPS